MEIPASPLDLSEAMESGDGPLVCATDVADPVVFCSLAVNAYHNIEFNVPCQGYDLLNV
jgi:hypothetical protein